VLLKALQLAVLIGYLRFNPLYACTLFRIEKLRIERLDEVQLVDFLKEAQRHLHKYLYKITVFTEMREGEVLGLTWNCIDFEQVTLLIKQQLRR